MASRQSSRSPDTNWNIGQGSYLWISKSYHDNRLAREHLPSRRYLGGLGLAVDAWSAASVDESAVGGSNVSAKGSIWRA